MNSINGNMREDCKKCNQTPMLLRVIALVLSLALCTSIVWDNKPVAYAEDSNEDFDVYKYMADNILSEETQAYGKFYFYYNSVESQAQIWSNSMTDEFADSVRKWEYINIALEPSEALDKPIDARGYYVSIILDMLKVSYGDTKFVLDKLLNKNVKNGSKIYTSFAKAFKEYSNMDLDAYLAETDHTDDEEALLKTVQEKYLRDNKFLESAQAIDDLLKAIKVGKNVVEYTETFLSYCALSDVSNEWYICVKNMRKYCDSSNAPLCNALDLIIEQMESDDYKNAAYQIALDGAQEGAVALLQKGVDKLWEGLTGPVGAAMKWGKAIGGSISNFLFGTDKTIEAYYTVNAYCIVMDLFKDSFEEIERLYRNEPTTENAALFLRAVDMYFNLLQTGNKFGQEFTDVLYEGGIVNLIVRSQKEYEEMTENTEYFIRATKEAHSYVMSEWLIDLYSDSSIPNNIDLYNKYVDIIGQENLDALYYIPVGSVTFEQDSVEWGYADFDHKGYKCTVLPEKASFKEVVYTSSDKKIAEITNSGHLRVNGIGTCTITVTSCDDDSISDTLEVTVVPSGGADSVKAELIKPITPQKPDESVLEFEELSNGTYEVSGLVDDDLKETLTEVTIPSTYNGENVTSIGDYAFDNCSALATITIPDSVTSIGDNAFYDCDSLTSITIPDSVTSIGDYAFSSCSSLTSITIPDSVTSIGDYVFSSCSSLSSITIPDSVTSIGDYAFSGCSSLTSITIPDSVTSIGYNAFFRCSSLSSITIPDSVTSINGVFSGCSSLSSITIPDSVTSINGAFSGCSSLSSITIPDSVTSINGAFFGCSSLSSITIPDSVTLIGEAAFMNCNSLTSVTIPDSVTGIGNNAFSGCSSFTSITIPNSVTGIGNSAFSGCSSFTSITIPDSVTGIGNYAFSGCSSLTSITIPDSVTGIGGGAFSGCSSLTSITIPDSITYIQYYAFSGCSSLTSITIPDGVTYILHSAFKDCNSLTSITIPDSVTGIGSGAFSGCSSLTSITIPYRVCSIGSNTFDGCSSLTSVIMPHTYRFQYIDEFVFSDCSSLTSIIIPDSVEFIKQGGFWCCSSLESITIPKSVTEIYESAFYGCDTLSDVYYAGTEDEWNAIIIESDNDYLLNATIHYNTATPPSSDNKVIVNISVPKPAGSTIGGGFRASVQNLSGSVADLPIDEDGALDISNIPDGEYTFIFSGDNCAPRSYTVVVTDGAVSGLDDGVELHLYGDITGDGVVDIKDVAKANMHFKNGSGLSGYEFNVSDINGDGIIDIKDVAKMNAHFKQTGNLWQ